MYSINTCIETCQNYIVSNVTHKHTPLYINICILFCTCVYGRRENVYEVVYLYENISIHEYIPTYPQTLYFYSPMSRYT